MTDLELRKRVVSFHCVEHSPADHELVRDLWGEIIELKGLPMARATKLIASYTPKAQLHSERCELCRHFHPPDGCSRVQGEIKPEGWCKFFARKETKAS